MDAVLLKNSRLLKGATFSSLKKELKNGAIWVDMHESEIASLHEFGITNALFRTIKASELPIYYEFNKTVSLLLLKLKFDGAITKERIYIFARNGQLITINCRKQLEVFSQIGKGEPSIESALCFLLVSLTESNERLMEELELKVEGIQDRLIRKHDMQVDQVLSSKRMILSVNKVLWHEREIIFYLRHCSILDFGQAERAQLDEAHNSVLYCVDLNSTYREILTDSLDVFHTIVSNKINTAIKKLTIVTIVLAIIATITSIPNTIATIFGIPYFPIKPDTKVAIIFGYELFPWDIIVLLLVLGSVVPSMLLYVWWQKMKKDSEHHGSTH
ncbi:MAG: CorA family divalent cation transporter [Candidatus Micrarchaeota archaeon]